MRNLALAALAAIALVCPQSALAQQQIAPYAGRRPATQDASLVSQNDAATVYLTGSSWASVYWTVKTAGSGGITTEYSKDAGANWLATAYSSRIDNVTANPSTAPWANNTPVVGTYETPIPANCTAFRIRYQTAGTTTSVSVSPGVAYAPGVPVVATLFDQTSGTNAALSTGVLDVSGWTVLVGAYTAGAAGSFVPKLVDDAGAVPAFGNSAYAGTGTVFSWGNGVTTSPSVPYVLPRRVQYDSAAIVGQTSRFLIVARR